MNALGFVRDRWNRFWFAEGSTESLGILRIFYGLTVFCKFTGLWGLERFPRWKLRLPMHRRPPISELGDLYRDPVPGFDWIPAVPHETWATIEAIALVAAVFWVIGLFTRTSSIVIFLFFAVPMLHSRFDYWHHASNFAFFMMLFVLLPMGDHFSVDRWLRKTPAPPRTMMPVRMVQVLLTWVYLSTLAGKLNAQWWDGTMMTVMADHGMLKGPFREPVLSILGPTFLGRFTLFAQGFFAVGVWTRWRRWAMFFAANLHLGIDSLMNVTTFSFQMISLYICFIDPRARQTTVYFDPTSTWQAVVRRVGALLDWFARLRWVDVRTTTPSVDEPPPPRDGLLLECSDGRRYRGLRAARELTGRLPLTFLPSFVLEVWWMATALLRGRRTSRSDRSR